MGVGPPAVFRLSAIPVEDAHPALYFSVAQYLAQVDIAVLLEKPAIGFIHGGIDYSSESSRPRAHFPIEFRSRVKCARNRWSRIHRQASGMGSLYND